MGNSASVHLHNECAESSQTCSRRDSLVVPSRVRLLLISTSWVPYAIKGDDVHASILCKPTRNACFAHHMQMLAGDQLLGRYGQLLSSFCHLKRTLEVPQPLLASALLALTQMMAVNSNFCSNNVALLFTLLLRRYLPDQQRGVIWWFCTTYGGSAAHMVVLHHSLLARPMTLLIVSHLAAVPSWATRLLLHMSGV